MQFKTKAIVMSFFFLLPLFSGCGPSMLNGMIYKHVKIPLSKDLNHTPAPILTGDGKIMQVKEPISGYGFYAKFNSNAIGDIAHQKGLKKVYFADLEIFSVLGIWTFEKIYIYGE